jgi:peptidoglycan/xylan/chitin deacetylase (PgdA/CDA1 family)
MKLEKERLREVLLALKNQGASFCFAGEEKTRRDVSMTFDDGYADNYLQAFPIFEELEVPLTLFLNTDWLDGQGTRWVDEVCSRVDDSERAREISWEGYDQESEKAFELLEVASDGREPMLDPEARALSSSEVKLMSQSPWVRIEAHGHSHRPHRCLNESNLRKDFIQNFDQIEEITGRRPTSYAFPFGRLGDLAPSSLNILAEMGIRSAYLAEGRNNYPWTHPLLKDREVVA